MKIYFYRGLFFCLMLALLGCGQMVKQTQPADSGPPMNLQIGAQCSEVVLARSSVILNLGSAGVNKQSVDALASQSVQVLADVNLVMPPMTTFAVSSNVSFNIKTNAVQEAGGQIDINLFYNNVLETSLNKVFIRARLLSGNGLSGKTLATSIIPLDLAVGGGAYSQLTSANQSVREWNKPFNDVIAQSLSLKLRGDFSRAISQQYQGTIVFELVKDENSPVMVTLLPPAMILYTSYYKALNFPNDGFEASLRVSSNMATTVKIKAEVFSEDGKTFLKEKIITESTLISKGFQNVVYWKRFEFAPSTVKLENGKSYLVKVSVLDSEEKILSSLSNLVFADPTFITQLAVHQQSRVRSVNILTVTADSPEAVFSSPEFMKKVTELQQQGQVFSDSYSPRSDLKKRLNDI